MTRFLPAIVVKQGHVTYCYQCLFSVRYPPRPLPTPSSVILHVSLTFEHYHPPPPLSAGTARPPIFRDSIFRGRGAQCSNFTVHALQQSCENVAEK